MGPIESHEKKVFRKNPNMGLQAILNWDAGFGLECLSPEKQVFFFFMVSLSLTEFTKVTEPKNLNA